MTRPARVGFAGLLVVVALLGVGVRLAALATGPSCRLGTEEDVLALEATGEEPPGCTVVNDATSYLAGSKGMLEGHPYAEPVVAGQDGRDDAWTPSALHPPGYVTYLAGWRLLGVDGFDGLRVATALLGGVTVAGVGLVGRRVAGERTGLVAAGLAAVHPLVWINDIVLMSEALYGPLAVGVALAAYRWWDRRTAADEALLGAAIGLAALTRSEAVLALPLVGVPLFLGAWPGAWRRGLASLATTAVVAAVVVSPWLIANQARFDRPVLFTTSAGAGLRLANCDDTYYTGERLGSRSPACLLELRDPDAAEGVTLPPDPDQSDLDRAILDATVPYIRDNAGRAPVVALARVGRMWGLYRPFDSIRLDEPVEQRGIGRSQLGLVVSWALLPLAVWGGVLLHRRRVPLSPLVSWVASATLVAVTNLGLHRFRAAADLAVCVLAAVAVDEWAARRRSASGAEGRPCYGDERRVAGVDERDGLENRCGVTATVGSNPTPSARPPRRPRTRPAGRSRRVALAPAVAVLALALLAGCGGDDDDAQSEVERFCADSGLVLAQGPPTPEGDSPEELEEFRTAVAAYAEELDTATERAPEEIRDAMETTNAAIQDLAEVVVEGEDPSQISEAVAEATADPGFTDASRDVAEFFRERCA